ncbi:MAG: diguanylate cyclase [Polyangiaceae bacterium]|jgi:diguanylate cyclase (GGDEF)-like protein
MTLHGGSRPDDKVDPGPQSECTKMHAGVVVAKDDTIRERVTRVLEAHGWSVLNCTDGTTAIEIATKETVDAIVAEVDLPDMSGTQLFRLLEQEASLADVVLVLLAAPGDSRAPLFANATCPRAHVIHSPESELPPLLDRFSRITPLGGRPASEPITKERLTRRLSRALDDAMFEAVVAAEVRALAAFDGYEQFFFGLETLVRRLLAPVWVALLVEGPTPGIFLSAPVVRRAQSEASARAAFGVADDVRCAVFRPAAGRGLATDVWIAVEVPVFSGNRQCGQFAVGLPRRSHTRAGRRTVDLIASELGGPWRIVSLLEEARRTAATDPLTGLMNRRALLEQIARENNRSQRYGHALAVLILDIDHFKQVNDGHGHFAGDRVIQTVATTAAHALRQSDYIARWGGEEFLIALPCAEPVGGLTTGERLRRAIEGATTTAADGSVLRVTVSIGVAHAPAPWVFEDLARGADAALYEAKARGRNCVRAVPDLIGPARPMDRVTGPETSIGAKP